ncbi:RTA1 like protein-domain-containing protein [Clohesyomyces aquaticus]|uniref:RTA1 like protein-domain-containing protein n=1 Tax=Clohesyomyces aquaticus TaxID=1231657 RepID=A0A1Y1ZIN8_9PLEO|nr:RTA1 like protein-domain-containing protein [Clohesyomyces aquaticus]
MTDVYETVNVFHRAVPYSGRHILQLNPYIYNPNIPAAIVGAIIFPLISIFLLYQFFRYRSWFFWAAMVGVVMETMGFLCRIISATDVNNDLPFLISFLMILLAPSFLAAACYTAFSRVLWFSCPPHALNFKTLWCFPKYITPTFVAIDLFSSLLQIVGAGQISRQYDDDPSHDRTIEYSEQTMRSGRVILVLGLILQMSCFASFAVISIRYFLISLQWRSSDLGDWKMWRKLCWMINIAAALITLRAMYRTLEIPHDKNTGLRYLQAHEWCFWCFDAMPIGATLAVMAIWHPGRFLPRSYTGWRLNKGKALLQKGEIRGPSMNGELKDFTPGDFGGGLGQGQGRGHGKGGAGAAGWRVEGV